MHADTRPSTTAGSSKGVYIIQFCESTFIQSNDTRKLYDGGVGKAGASFTVSCPGGGCLG